MITLSGLSRSQISRYESGLNSPSIESLERLLDALGLPLAALNDAERFLKNVRNLEASPSTSSPTLSLDHETRAFDSLHHPSEAEIREVSGGYGDDPESTRLAYRAGRTLTEILLRILDETRPQETRDG